MSHEHELHPDYAGPVPEDPRPPRVTGTSPPPPQPSTWLESTVAPAGDEPASAPDEPVVIAEDDEGPPLRGPRSRPRLPYGQGWRKPDTAAAVPPAAVPAADRQAGEVRLKILDTWMRSGLPAGDFAPLVNVSKHTLYTWKSRFEAEGPAGLMDRPKGSGRGSRLPELTKRAILLMKQMHLVMQRSR